jgi:multicomponent Na+:H+ antiporter subunit G
MLTVILDLLTVAALLFGLFFLFIGALGLHRLPDLYNRMHAATKCVTLGITGMLIAVLFHLVAIYFATAEGEPLAATGAIEPVTSGEIMRAITKTVLVIIFQFVAAPVGAHMLSRAAHLDNADLWEGTLSDELEDDLGPLRIDRIAPAEPPHDT